METLCTYDGNRDEALVAYLYNDGDPAERAAFDAHLVVCPVCRAELHELGIVRTELGRWGPPSHGRVLAFQPPSQVAARSRLWTVLGEIPRWTQVAAALLFIGVAAGAANLDVRYDRDGLSVRTGWSGSRGAAPTRSAISTPTGAAETTPAWRAELAALEQRLRADLGPENASAHQIQVQQTAGTDAIMRRVRTIVDQSERRQQRELALRVGELVRDVQAQRQVDLVRIDRTLGYIQNDTGAEVMRQRRLLNDLAVRVTQKQ